MEQVLISDSAAARIGELLQKEAPGSALRVSVNGGGCSGFQYKFDFTPVEKDDLIFNKNSAIVVTDTTSIDFLKGSIIDFTNELGGAYFSVKNPNATSSCGCGTSFAV